MTVAHFDNWQRSAAQPGVHPYNRCSPNLVLVGDHLIVTWGGQILGCYNLRSIIGGTSTSSHAYGAARDWGWDIDIHRGPGRQILVDIIIPWLIAHSEPLGIQAIHDYYGGRIWRSNRANDANGGWRQQPLGQQMGRSWARWIHLETNIAAWADSRPIADRIAPPDPVPPPPINLTPVGGLSMYQSTRPARVLDTRALGAPLAAGSTTTVDCRVPDDATAVFVNVTAVGADSAGYVTAWGTGDRPNTSDLNLDGPGQVRVNGTFVDVDAAGRIRIYTDVRTHLLVDVKGYMREAV